MDNLTLNGKHVSLIPYEEKHFDFIFNCFQEYDSRMLFTNDMNIVSKGEFFEDFKKKINNYYHVYMIINDVLTNLPVGFIYSYKYNNSDEYLYTAIYIQDKSRSGLFGGEAGMMFYKYLFSYFPIRKIYCNVYEYNDTSLKFLKSAGFEIEGEMKEHRYFNGKYHSMYVLSLYRQQFDDVMSKF